jgi:hypothetical protein
VSGIISALSYALDLTEGQPMGHSVRTCIIGMRLAKHLGLPMNEQGDLYYALLLKDAGCSSNSSRLFHTLSADEIRAKRDVKLTDWTRVGWESLRYALTHVATGAPFLERMRTLVRVAAKQQTESCELVKIRCERGASVARRMGFPESVAKAIHSLDEHWNGRGYPDGLRGRSIAEKPPPWRWPAGAASGGSTPNWCRRRSLWRSPAACGPAWNQSRRSTRWPRWSLKIAAWT